MQCFRWDSGYLSGSGWQFTQSRYSSGLAHVMPTEADNYSWTESQCVIVYHWYTETLVQNFEDCLHLERKNLVQA